IQTARMVRDAGLDLEGLTTEEARKRLIGHPGVGRKVADCVLLFSMGKYDVFPVDIWIKRVIEVLYMAGAEVRLNDIYQFAEDRFGELSGYAQEYLYYYARTSDEFSRLRKEVGR